VVNGTPVAGVPSPPGLDQRGGLHGVGAQCGHAGSDWLALAGPQMSDIGATSRDWWLFVLRHSTRGG